MTTTKTNPLPAADDRIDQRIQSIWTKAYAAQDQNSLRDLYAEWASHYDEDHDHIGFIGHRIAAEVVGRMVARRDVRVLDAGAGTGAAGVELARLGFQDITAVDLSPEMLQVAESKGVYGRTIVADLAFPVDALPRDSFDVAVLVGVFSYGQAPVSTFDELLRVVRPGGVVVFTMRTDFHEEDAMGIRSRIEELESSGVWTSLEITEPAPYLPRKDPDAQFRVWAYRVVEGPGVETELGFEEAVHDAVEAEGGGLQLDHSWIWDTVASRLYDRYTESQGYYLTDCEVEILSRHADQVSHDDALFIELGCGSALKIGHVLRAAVEKRAGDAPIRYMPIDVSQGALDATVEDLGSEFQGRVTFEPKQGLFGDVLEQLPEDQRKVIFFFGSSIGNVPRLEDTVKFLEMVRSKMRAGDRFVIGADLHKPEEVLDAAYNRDESCRQFFVHMVRRINDALGADFDPRVFELASEYVLEPPACGMQTHRMNLSVAPTRDQRSFVKDLGRDVLIREGDAVQVGISRKFELDQLDRLAALGGFRVNRRWLDEREWFSVNELVPVES